MSALPDPRRTIGDLLRLGTIERVDLGVATCRVRTGDNVTGDIPWLAPSAGPHLRIWSPPGVGEQCLLICPEGDSEAGLALTGLFSDAHPAPSADPLVLVEFGDGTRLSYDPAAHALTVALAANGTASLSAPGGLSIEGDVSIAGNVQIGDTLTAHTDVIGGGKSLKGHRHLQVQPGSGVSGAPQ